MEVGNCHAKSFSKIDFCFKDATMFMKNEQKKFEMTVWSVDSFPSISNTWLLLELFAFPG